MAERAELPARVLVSGHARLPQDAAARSVYDILTIVAEVETGSWTVVDVDATLVTDVARTFVRTLLRGRSLLQPPDGLLKAIELSYHGGAKRAVLAAVRELHDRVGEVRAGFGL